MRDQVKRLAAVYGEGWFQDQEHYASVDRYLEEVIARKPKDPVFDEPFTFADLYVPLQVQRINNCAYQRAPSARRLPPHCSALRTPPSRLHAVQVGTHQLTLLSLKAEGFLLPFLLAGDVLVLVGEKLLDCFFVATSRPMF